MVELTVSERGTARTKSMFLELAKRVGDFKPIWADFIPLYRKVVVAAGFKTQGALMGKKWDKLSDRYAAKVGSSTATLRRSDRLYNAAMGGAGWTQKETKKSLTFGIEGVPYAAIHQHGSDSRGMPQRPYLFTTDDDLPLRGWKILLDVTNKYIEEVDK